MLTSVNSGLQIAGAAIAVNILLAVVKIVTGIVGHSYALVADGIESTADVVTSLIVWGGLRLSAALPDRRCYGSCRAR